MRSWRNFSNILTGNELDMPQMSGTPPRGMSATGIISEPVGDGSRNEQSDDNTSAFREKKVIVANFLPLHAQKDIETGKWLFSLDEDSLLLQLKDGFASESNVVYVGSLKVEVDESEQNKVAKKLMEEFNCVPTFLDPEIQRNFYLGFCKQHLWPLFHYMLPLHHDHGNLFDQFLWKDYVSANRVFADKVMGVIDPEEPNDYVWIHDYHLMLLPLMLRRRFSRCKICFFLHIPFPSSEIYRTLPVSGKILKALLNADLVGFQTYDYARHFLSSCSTILGLNHETNRGYIALTYFGRTVSMKIMHAGVHVGRLQSALNHPSSAAKVKEIQEQFKGKKLILGVDDMDIFKGITLKLLAIEQFLEQHSEWRGVLVLVQIVNPARSTGKDIQEVERETNTITERINGTYGLPGYEPVILIQRTVPLHEKSAYYALAECCIVNAVRDGLNLVPYEYTVCRQGTPETDEAMGFADGSPHISVLVVSEFIGCSASLSGAIRVNPWNIDALVKALEEAIKMTDLEKQLRHKKHYSYISSHDVAYWARSFLLDLKQACKDHYIKQNLGMGFGLDFRLVSLSPKFRKLSSNHIVSAYKRTNSRAIFLDYDGTLVSNDSVVSSTAKSPNATIISVLNNLCGDPKNTVFIVSGRGRISLSEWFAECVNLGIAAEHGYFIRWNKMSNWESRSLDAEYKWKNIVEPLMKSYTETTNGSYIEGKESALVWHHGDANPTFGSDQAKELLDHLQNVLANEPVIVKKGHLIVEVKPQWVSKGLVAEKVLSTMINGGKPPDFVLCIGDDRSDEDMFESISRASYTSSLPVPPETFACTVGQKPSKASYYLEDTDDVLGLLQDLAASSSKSKNCDSTGSDEL